MSLKSFKRFVRPLSVAALVCGFAISSAKADNDCGSLKLPDIWRDTLLVNVNGTWKPIADTFVRSLVSNSTSKSYRFVYVAKGTPGDRGVIVVKSGNEIDENDPAYSERVKLRRKRTVDDEGDRCKVPGKPAFADTVSGLNYDRFHDQGLERLSEIEKLKAFHIPYVRRNKSCAFTDDVRNGNRAKFSFDQSVIATGTLYSKLWFFKRAFAGNKLVLRRVEMEPYRLNSDGQACLSFRLQVHKTTVLRIEDLER